MLHRRRLIDGDVGVFFGGRQVGLGQVGLVDRARLQFGETGRVVRNRTADDAIQISDPRPTNRRCARR